MAYFKTFDQAKSKTLFEAYGTHCFCCSKPIEGEYHAFPTPGNEQSVFMHRGCAFAMAQRLILDTWHHRHDEPRMTAFGV